MAQKVKWHQDPSLNPWLGMVVCTVIPVLEEGLRRSSKTYWPTNLTKPVSSRLSERACFKNKVKNH